MFSFVLEPRPFHACFFILILVKILRPIFIFVYDLENAYSAEMVPVSHC